MRYPIFRAIPFTAPFSPRPCKSVITRFYHTIVGTEGYFCSNLTLQKKLNYLRIFCAQDSKLAPPDDASCSSISGATLAQSELLFCEQTKKKGSPALEWLGLGQSGLVSKTLDRKRKANTRASSRVRQAFGGSAIQTAKALVEKIFSQAVPSFLAATVPPPPPPFFSSLILSVCTFFDASTSSRHFRSPKLLFDFLIPIYVVPNTLRALQVTAEYPVNFGLASLAPLCEIDFFVVLLRRHQIKINR